MVGIPTPYDQEEIKTSAQNIDGLDQWEAIKKNLKSPRMSMAYNVDDEIVPDILNVPNKNTSFQVTSNTSHNDL